MHSSTVPSFHGVWQLPIITAVIGLVLATLLSAVMPLKYSSTMRLLITQVNASGLDPYTAMKATERIATSLSELVYTSTFYQNVISKAQTFDVGYFPQDEYNRRKEWRKTIETSVTPGTGIMTVSAFHPNVEQARLLVQSVSEEIAKQAPSYFGTGVRAQVIDSPLDSRWYAKPNFFSNAILGLFAGLLIGIAWSLWQWPSREW